MIAFTNTTFVELSPPNVRVGHVVADGDRVEVAATIPPGAAQIDCTGKLVMPGLVCAGPKMAWGRTKGAWGAGPATGFRGGVRGSVPARLFRLGVRPPKQSPISPPAIKPVCTFMSPKPRSTVPKMDTRPSRGWRNA